MNEKNLNYLKDQVKYTGFGDALEAQLKEKMNEGKPAFDLEFSAIYGKDLATARLQFTKSGTSDNYFFNSYQLELKKPGQEQPVRQTFHIGYDNNVTMKEGVNLLSGRAVYKELAKLIDTGKDGNKRLEPRGEKYHAWQQLDFTNTDNRGNYKVKQFTDNYGFDLESVLNRYPIKELADREAKERLIESLQKGNRQAVTFLIDNKEERRYLEAAPQFKSINQYDADMNRTGLRRQQQVEDSASALDHQRGQQQDAAKNNTNTQSKMTGKRQADPVKKTRSTKKGKTIS